jgi:type IV pilus assembly protein PilA
MLNVLRKNKGFSLVELMIVVAIIGILAAVAIPNFQRFQRKARQSEARSLLSGLYTATSSARSEWGVYVGDFLSNGYAPDGQLTYRVDFAEGANERILNNNMAIPGASAAAGNCITTFGVVGGFPAGCTVAFAMWAQRPNGIASSLPGPTAAAVAGVANGGNTFTATAGAFIGGAIADNWTIDQTKNLQNTVVGLD